MATKIVTLNQLLDDAVGKLPFVRRKVMQLRLRSPKFRESVNAELTLKLYEEPAFGSLQQVFGSETFNGDKPFAIDIDQIERVLELIIKYLPQIISLFQNLFSAILFVVLIFAGDSAMAQCANGQCQMPRQPVRQVVQRVLPPLAAPVPRAPMAAPVFQESAELCMCGCEIQGCNCSVMMQSIPQAASPIMQQTEKRYRGRIGGFLRRLFGR